MTMTQRREATRRKRAGMARGRALKLLRFVARRGGARARSEGGGRYRVVSCVTGHDCCVSDDILRAGIDQGLDIKIVP